MFRPGLNARCRARLGTGLVAQSSTAELRNVQIRGMSEGLQQWQHHRGLTLERSTSEATMRAREAFHVVVSPGNRRRHQSGAMLASVPSVSLTNVEQLTGNHTSDSCTHNSSEDVESSADSGGSSESSTMSDGDSVNIKDSQHLLRITSGASMVAESDMDASKVEAKVESTSGSMLEENEGENEVDEDVNIRPESPARNSDLEAHSVQGEPVSAATTWTDDKHSSFLNSMEATFVRSLYNQQGLGHLGVYGDSAQIDDSEQDCVESRPVDAYGCSTSYPSELFELGQGGQQHQKAYGRPHALDPPPAATKTAVLANPWVRHFKQRTVNSEDVFNHPSTCPLDVIVTPLKEFVSAVDVSQMNLHNVERDENMIVAITKDNDFEEKQRTGASEDIDNKETQNCVEIPEVEQGFRLWQNRLQVGGQTVVNPSSRKDMTTWVLKRPPTFDIENADVLVTKRIKSTQQELAQKDLEMLEQYVAKQRAESVQAGGEHPEQAILENARKVVGTSGEEAGPSSTSEPNDTRKVARSAMDQVVPLLGRMDSYESRGSVCFPDLNAPSHLPTGPACAVTVPPVSEVRERRALLSSVPDLNALPRIPVAPEYTTNQPTINFTKDGESVATAWSPRPEVESMEDKYFHELAGTVYQPFVQGCQEECHDVGNLSLELQTKGLEAGEAFECEPQLSPVSNSRTWTWGLGGFRRRQQHVHTAGVPASQPSRSLRDGIHFSDPVPFRSSGQQV